MDLIGRTLVLPSTTTATVVVVVSFDPVTSQHRLVNVRTHAFTRLNLTSTVYHPVPATPSPHPTANIGDTIAVFAKLRRERAIIFAVIESQLHIAYLTHDTTAPLPPNFQLLVPSPSSQSFLPHLPPTSISPHSSPFPPASKSPPAPSSPPHSKHPPTLSSPPSSAPLRASSSLPPPIALSPPLATPSRSRPQTPLRTLPSTPLHNRSPLPPLTLPLNPRRTPAKPVRRSRSSSVSRAPPTPRRSLRPVSQPSPTSQLPSSSHRVSSSPRTSSASLAYSTPLKSSPSTLCPFPTPTSFPPYNPASLPRTPRRASTLPPLPPSSRAPLVPPTTAATSSRQVLPPMSARRLPPSPHPAQKRTRVLPGPSPSRHISASRPGSPWKTSVSTRHLAPIHSPPTSELRSWNQNLSLPKSKTLPTTSPSYRTSTHAAATPRMKRKARFSNPHAASPPDSPADGPANSSRSMGSHMPMMLLQPIFVHPPGGAHRSTPLLTDGGMTVGHEKNDEGDVDHDLKSMSMPTLGKKWQSSKGGTRYLSDADAMMAAVCDRASRETLRQVQAALTQMVASETSGRHDDSGGNGQMGLVPLATGIANSVTRTLLREMNGSATGTGTGRTTSGRTGMGRCGWNRRRARSNGEGEVRVGTRRAVHSASSRVLKPGQKQGR